MRIQKNIYFFDKKEEISIVYTNEGFKAGDSEVAIYDKYKISILLSDGINAVVSNSIIGGEKYNILFFRPDEIHFGNFAKKGVYSYLDIFIPITFFESFTNSKEITNFLTDKDEKRINCLHFDAEARTTAISLSSDIISLITDNDNFNDIKLFSLILQTVILCNDFYEAEKAKPLNQSIPEFVLKAISYISESYEKKLSVKEIAEVSRCSVVYLSRLFKKYMNMSIYGFVTTIRISNAQKLLKEGKSVTEACFLCGFNDCSNFAGKFKRITGQTPSDFQKKL